MTGLRNSFLNVSPASQSFTNRNLISLLFWSVPPGKHSSPPPPHYFLSPPLDCSVRAGILCNVVSPTPDTVNKLL